MDTQTGNKTIYMLDGGEKTVPDFILDRFKDKENAVEEQAKMALNAEKRMEEALAELNKLKQGETTRSLVLGEKDKTIEELKGQIAKTEIPVTPTTATPRYNPQYVAQYCQIYGIFDDEGNPDLERGMQALDFMRGVEKYDRDTERLQNEKELNTKEVNKQWDKLVRDFGEEFVAERGPEIRSAFKEYPELAQRAYKDEKALLQVVRIANAEYDETKAALKEEEEELEKEKLRGQVTVSGKRSVEKEKDRARYKKMSKEEIAEEIGFANPDDRSQYV